MAASRQQSVKPSRNFMLAHCEAECAAYRTAADRRVMDRKVMDRRVGYGA